MDEEMEDVFLRMDMRGLGMGVARKGAAQTFARNGAAQHYKKLLTHKLGGRHAAPKAREEHAPPKAKEVHAAPKAKEEHAAPEANQEHAAPKAKEQEACKPLAQRLLQQNFAVAAGRFEYQYQVLMASKKAERKVYQNSRSWVQPGVQTTVCITCKSVCITTK